MEEKQCKQVERSSEMEIGSNYVCPLLDKSKDIKQKLIIWKGIIPIK